jgi:hypothetical protein
MKEYRLPIVQAQTKQVAEPGPSQRLRRRSTVGQCPLAGFDSIANPQGIA